MGLFPKLKWIHASDGAKQGKTRSVSLYKNATINRFGKQLRFNYVFFAMPRSPNGNYNVILKKL